MFKCAEKLNLERSSDIISKKLVLESNRMSQGEGTPTRGNEGKRGSEQRREGREQGRGEVTGTTEESTVQEPRIFAASQTRIRRQDVGCNSSNDNFDIADSFGTQHHSILYGRSYFPEYPGK